jgi:hypothetical protein
MLAYNKERDATVSCGAAATIPLLRSVLLIGKF